MNLSSTKDEIVTCDEAAILLSEASSISEPIDAGHSIAYRIDHPERGKLILVNSAAGKSLIFPV